MHDTPGGLEAFGFFTGVGLMIALPMWAYWFHHARMEVEKERTRQLALQLELKRLDRQSPGSDAVKPQ